MYICASCESVFDEPCREDMGAVPYGDTYVSMGECSVCPDCGGEDIAEAGKCERCGDWVCESDLENGFCAACAAEVMKYFKAVLDGHFTVEEIEFIREMWS